MVAPRSLVNGDTIAVVAPAGAFDHKLLDGACDVLHSAGYRTVVMPHVLGRVGSYSGTADERFADLADAFACPSVRAVLCARGGYGAVHLLQRLDGLHLSHDPKWLIGFSDISALHALMLHKGIMSVHAPMLKGLVRENSVDGACTACLLDILQGKPVNYAVDADRRNHFGDAQGIVAGGNLAVLSALIGTKYDVFKPGRIVFIEDINEPAYKVERVLWQLRLGGVLGSLRGLFVGRFTGADEDAVYDMIADMVADVDYPVAFGWPVGHVDYNLPMIEGATAQLHVGSDGASLRF